MVSMRRRKYNNQKVIVDGCTFDSKAEARRWIMLSTMQKSGLISELKRQVAIELLPGVKFLETVRRQPALRLIVDFEYQRDGQRVLEDVKSAATMTPAFRIKRHVLAALHGLQVEVVP
jgi:hypothetical protein